MSAERLRRAAIGLALLLAFAGVVVWRFDILNRPSFIPWLVAATVAAIAWASFSALRKQP